MKARIAFLSTIVSTIVMTLGLSGGVEAGVEQSPELDPGYLPALEARARIEQRLETADFAAATYLGLDALIDDAAKDLIARERQDLAEELLDQYDHLRALQMTLDLGDHDPLSPFLAYWCMRLEQEFGPWVDYIPYYRDLWILNYSIPVVYHPGGDPKSGVRWEQEEYRKHFVPLSGVLTYHAAKYACKKTISVLCGPIAWSAKKVTEKWVAPAISDEIWFRANAKK